MRVKLSSRGITIPAEVRKRLGLKPGDVVLLEVRGGLLFVTPETKNPPEEPSGFQRDAE